MVCSVTVIFHSVDGMNVWRQKDGVKICSDLEVFCRLLCTRRDVGLASANLSVYIAVDGTMISLVWTFYQSFLVHIVICGVLHVLGSRPQSAFVRG